MPDSNLLILGASARAAARSARRCGYRPLAADLFCDADLTALCPWTRRITEYPDGLVVAANDAPAGPWMYTGALENRPQVVDRISQSRHLLGNSGTVLAAVRDPHRLAVAVRGAGLLFPRTFSIDALPSTALRADRRWLRKPFASCGGTGILRMTDEAIRRIAAAAKSRHERHTRPADLPSVYLQHEVAGTPCSSTYVAAQGRACLLGVTRQLVGCDWAGARGFQYSGSIGPFAIDGSLADVCQRLGNCLAREFSLSGLFGVDLIVDPPRVWTIEVNPRYTASVEILEQGLGLAAIELHIAACRGELPRQDRHVGRGTCCGKAVLYASRELHITQEFVAAAWQANAGRDEAQVADIPQSGSVIEPGKPICTVFAAGTDAGEVERRLRANASHWRAEMER